jgi:hypothetical protein
MLVPFKITFTDKYVTALGARLLGLGNVYLEPIRGSMLEPIEGRVKARLFGP